MGFEGQLKACAHQVAHFSCGRSNEIIIFMRRPKHRRNRFQEFIIRKVRIPRLRLIRLVGES